MVRNPKTYISSMDTDTPYVKENPSPKIAENKVQETVHFRYQRNVWRRFACWKLGKRTVEPVEYYFFEVDLEAIVINGVKLLHLYQLVVEPTHLKDMLVKMKKSSPSFGMKIKNVWNHHAVWVITPVTHLQGHLQWLCPQFITGMGPPCTPWPRPVANPSLQQRGSPKSDGLYLRWPATITVKSFLVPKTGWCRFLLGKTLTGMAELVCSPGETIIENHCLCVLGKNPRGSTQTLYVWYAICQRISKLVSKRVVAIRHLTWLGAICNLNCFGW